MKAPLPGGVATVLLGAGLALAFAIPASGQQNSPRPAPPKAAVAARAAAPPGPERPALAPELTAALQAAQTGNTAPLLKLADGGNADAQYYAGVMFIFGSKMVLKDAARGCAYEEKASKTRGDAMHLTGMCHQSGADGRPDLPKAEAAYRRAAEMGFIKSKCALGQILMADPPRAKEGLELCEAAGKAGDVEAQLAVANAYFAGAAGKSPDLGQARWWYEKAASQNSPNAMRRLGEMYARGDGGPKDTKKAIQLWTAAEQAGDPLVAILMADQLFAEMTGGRKPGPGTYGFRGGVPVADIEVVEQWYKLAQAKDPRPDVQERARYGLAILANFKTAAGVSAKRTNRR